MMIMKTDMIMMFFVFVLFVVLTPGVLLTLPPNSSNIVVALVHGLVFAVVFLLTHKHLMKLLDDKYTTKSATAY